jgi:radical SAM superfamily enzyme YgiQ (UPF0313 family)
MSDGRRLVPANGLLVVCVEGVWSVAPFGGTEPIEVDVEALIDLVRASNGVPTVFPDALADEMVAVGALVEAPGPAEGADVRPKVRAVESPQPVAGDEPMRAVPAFVATVTAGHLVVEGLAGRRLLLDPVDLVLLTAVASKTPLAQVLVDGREGLERLSLEVPSDDELRRRLQDLIDVGRLLVGDWGYPIPKAAADEETGPVAAPVEVSVYEEPPRYYPPGADPEVHYFADPRPDTATEGLVPVYAMFQVDVGPALSLGMLTAAARCHRDGALNEFFEIRRPEDPSSFLADLAGREGPAILLCSNYLWSIDHNLDVARQAMAVNPDLLVIHGGPSTPKYDGDAEQFFEEHADIAHVTVRGEGEPTLVEILDVLSNGLPALDRDALAGVAGVTFRDSSGAVVKNPDRDRVSELDTLPSPYLTGEFDHVHPWAWKDCLTIESNRGCPYGCTFCDWGSMTLSRIRKFDLDRVNAEMAWAGRFNHKTWVIADANFGIFARDVEITQRLADVKRQTGMPLSLGFTVAKNTTRHLTKIFDELIHAGVEPHCSLSLQSHDDETLEALRRTNISTEHYLSIATSFRTRGLPLLADLMVGLPGQTKSSFMSDVQFLFDHKLPTRIWPTQLLPNAPMNDPEYREEYQLVVDDEFLVVSSSTFDREDRDFMMRMRQANAVFEQYGLGRHLMRFLQWDHGLNATEFLASALDVSEEHPDRYPLLNFVLRYFELYPVPPFGWRAFYDEMRRFVVNELGIELSEALETVLELQTFLMPEYGREFPDTLLLEHDYYTYFEEATASLWTTGAAGEPPRPLSDYGPALFTAWGDPLDLCQGGMELYPDSRNTRIVRVFWIRGHLELDTPLVWNYPSVAAMNSYFGVTLRNHVEVVDLDRDKTSALLAELDRVAEEAEDDATAVRVGLPVRLRSPS